MALEDLADRLVLDIILTMYFFPWNSKINSRLSYFYFQHNVSQF